MCSMTVVHVAWAHGGNIGEQAWHKLYECSLPPANVMPLLCLYIWSVCTREDWRDAISGYQSPIASLSYGAYSVRRCSTPSHCVIPVGTSVWLTSHQTEFWSEWFTGRPYHLLSDQEEQLAMKSITKRHYGYVTDTPGHTSHGGT